MFALRPLQDAPWPWRLALAAALALLLAACQSSPPVRLYHLRALATPAASATAQAAEGVIALAPLQLPDYLDRAALLQREGAAGLRALDGHRWAEPLADASTRVLRDNLAARLGAQRVWAAPLPAGLRARHALRVELQRFEADTDGRHVLLAARWTWLDPAGSAAPRVQTQGWRVPAGSGSPDELAAAHAQALDDLAAAVAASLGTP